MRKLLFFDIFCKRHFWLAIKFQKFTFDWIPNLKFKPWIDIIMRSTHVPFWSHFWAAQQPKTNLCTGHNYGGWFFHYIESQGRWNHFGSLGYLLEFPKGRDGATFWDKGTKVPSLSRDKGTMAQAQNLAMGRAGPGHPVKIRDGTWDRTISIFLSKSGTIFFPIISCFATSFPVLECTFLVLEHPFLF